VIKTFEITLNTPETREVFSSPRVTVSPRAPFEKPSAKATTPWDSEPCLFRPLIHAQPQAILPTNLPYRLYPLFNSSSGVDRQLFAVAAREPNGERENQDIQDNQDGSGLESLPPKARKLAPS